MGLLRRLGSRIPRHKYGPGSFPFSPLPRMLSIIVYFLESVDLMSPTRYFLSGLPRLTLKRVTLSKVIILEKLARLTLSVFHI